VQKLQKNMSQEPASRVRADGVYKPNFADPRNGRRAARVLTFCEHFLKAGRPISLHHDRIASVFGNRGNKVSDWLKDRLLVQCGSYEPGKRSYSYKLNPYGYLALSLECKGRAELEEVLDDDERHELARLEFVYQGECQPYRLWHPLQWLNREKKGAFWTARGLRYNYDVSAALPNILYQSAVRTGAEPMRMTGLKSLIDKPKPFRDRFAELAGVDYDTAKNFINSLFYGATVSASPFTTFGQLPAGVIQSLQTDPAVRSLNWAIKFAWRKIEAKHGKMTDSERAYFYFREERRVLEVMRAHLAQTRNRHFCEHDGIITERVVTTEKLAQEIEQVTGYKLAVVLKPFVTA